MSEEPQPAVVRSPAAAGSDEAMENGAPELASLSRRFGALVVDWIACVLIAGGILGAEPGRTVLGNFYAMAVLVAEYAFFLGLFGQTLGMRLARVRCAPINGEGVIGVPRAALRGALLALVIPGLIMDNQRRGLHDRAAGSVMLAA